MPPPAFSFGPKCRTTTTTKTTTRKTRTMLNRKRSPNAFRAFPPPLLVLLVLLCCCFQLSESLIVPQELPSLLSLVYSNIPPIKKGTDSRLGFGFRLGEHADFQVLVELGPQKNTRPIGNPDKEDNSFNKRHVSKTDQRAVLRQQQQQKLDEQLTSTERTGANWLENWSKDMNAASSKKKSKQKYRGGATKKQQEKDSLLPTMPVVPSQSLQMLQMLYQMASTTTTEATPTTAAAAPLGGPLNLGGPAGFTARPTVVGQEAPPQLMAFMNPRHMPQTLQKTREEITASLSDVSLDEDGQ